MDRWWFNLLLIPTKRALREAGLVSTGNWLFSLGLGILPRPCFSCEQLSQLWEPNLPENPAGREAREEWQGQRPL